MSNYKNYKRKLRWKSSIRKEGMSHGLTPCPDCGGDIEAYPKGYGHAQEGWRCSGCGHTWPNTDESAQSLLPNIPCPQCGKRMYFRDGSSLGGMWPNGAWECESGDYSHMLRPEALVPDTYEDPDTSQSDLTLPEHWGRRKMAEVGHDPYQDLPVVAVVLNEDGTVYDQCWNWETGQSYAQQGYRVIALQDDPGAPSMTVDRQQAMYNAENGYRDDLFGQEQRPEGLTDALHSPESVNAEHPDPWMDNEPGTLTVPQHWGKRRRE